MLPDGTNFIVNSQSMCVDSTGRKPGDRFAVEAFDCNSHAHQRFTYTADGQLQARLGCLAVPLAADGAAVSIASCNSASNGQVFKLDRDNCADIGSLPQNARSGRHYGWLRDPPPLVPHCLMTSPDWLDGTPTLLGHVVEVVAR